MSKNDRNTEWLTAEVPKGTRASIRMYAAKNGYKSVSEVIRAAVDMLIKRKHNGGPIAAQIGGNR